MSAAEACTVALSAQCLHSQCIGARAAACTCMLLHGAGAKPAYPRQTHARPTCDAFRQRSGSYNEDVRVLHQPNEGIILRGRAQRAQHALEHPEARALFGRGHGSAPTPRCSAHLRVAKDAQSRGGRRDKRFARQSCQCGRCSHGCTALPDDSGRIPNEGRASRFRDEYTGLNQRMNRESSCTRSWLRTIDALKVPSARKGQGQSPLPRRPTSF